MDKAIQFFELRLPFCNKPLDNVVAVLHNALLVHIEYLMHNKAAIMAIFIQGQNKEDNEVGQIRRRR